MKNFEQKNLNKTDQVNSEQRTRVNITLDSYSHDLLKKLSKVCDVSKTSMAGEMVYWMLRNPTFLESIQNLHRVPKDERIIPIFNEGKVYYHK